MVEYLWISRDFFESVYLQARCDHYGQLQLSYVSIQLFIIC